MEKTECIIERSPTKPNTAKNARAHMFGFKSVSRAHHMMKTLLLFMMKTLLASSL